jgi:benzoyl-CoA reductase/2-hydroxyglutaryl-CoA dehydratase subunit BcrC/BadD/HgdB
METTKLKELKANVELKQIMDNHMIEIAEAVRTKSKKIAWCSSTGPVELARGMGFLVYFPEYHGVIIGQNPPLATDYIPHAVAHGYSPDICSYLNSDIGAYLKGETPWTQGYGMESIPKPDVLLYNTNQCREVYDWFSFYAKEWNIPIVGVNTTRIQPMVRDDIIKLGVTQLKEMVPTLEQVAGRKFDIDEFRETVRLSRELSDLWNEVIKTATIKPSPFSFLPDGLLHMGPVVLMRGTQEVNDFVKLLLAELEERISQGVAAIEGEKHRFYWEGMPIWGKFMPLSELFAKLKICVVASTYCNSWIFTDLDPKDPFESMAKAYSSIFITMDDEWKEDYIADIISRYNIDGVIYHDAKTCPDNCNNRYGMPDRLTKRTGVPHLVINGDHVDLRLFSEEQTITNVEAFVEQIEESN